IDECAAANTPLWPAGHLPLKGGDRLSRLLSQIACIAEMAVAPKLPISPLEGETADRPEGGGFRIPLRLRLTCMSGCALPACSLPRSRAGVIAWATKAG